MFQRGGKRTMGGESSLSFRRGVYKAWFRQTRLGGGGKGCRRFVNRGVGINFGVCGGWGWCYAFLEVFCRFRNWITSRAMTKHVLNVGSFRSPLKGKRKHCQDCHSGCIVSKSQLYIVRVLCFILLYFICHCIHCFGTEIFMSKIKSIKLLLCYFDFN